MHWPLVPKVTGSIPSAWRRGKVGGHNTLPESAKYSKHLMNRVLHGAPIIEVIFLREEKPVLALLMLSAEQGSHWYHFLAHLSRQAHKVSL